MLLYFVLYAVYCFILLFINLARDFYPKKLTNAVVTYK